MALSAASFLGGACAPVVDPRPCLGLWRITWRTEDVERQLNAMMNLRNWNKYPVYNPFWISETELSAIISRCVLNRTITTTEVKHITYQILRTIMYPGSRTYKILDPREEWVYPTRDLLIAVQLLRGA